MTSSPENWAAEALAMLQCGPVAMITIAQVSGSAPREAGTKMLVTPTKEWGTVGGGNLEHILIEQSRKLLERRDIDVLQQDYPLGPLLAQCCGGRVRVLVERLDAASREWLEECDAAERAGAPYVLQGAIDNGRIVRIFDPDPFASAPGVDLMNAAAGYADHKEKWTRIIERVTPVTATLVIFGAGHVGRAIAAIAATLPFRLTWLDNREEAAGSSGDATALIRRDVVNAVREAPAGAYYLVLTHSHDLDYDLVREILRRGDARYCGLIGSSTKRARFASRLAKDGLDAAKLTCPIGAGAIRSKLPAAIAVAACAELLELQEAAEAARSAQKVG